MTAPEVTSWTDPLCAPGVREMGAFKFYSAYLRDPQGNKLCAMHSFGG